MSLNYDQDCEMSKSIGRAQANLVAQFPLNGKQSTPCRISADDFPEQGSVVSLNGDLLLTVNVDSFFTWAYSSHQKSELFIREFRFEGFFTDDKTTPH